MRINKASLFHCVCVCVCVCVIRMGKKKDPDGAEKARKG